jgi:SAM-dependent methyltransferase
MILLLNIRQRGFAAMYDRLSAPAEPALAPYRQETAGRATGDVLEIGGGTGANLPFYRQDARLTVLEPNPYMAKRLQRKANELGREVTIVTELDKGLPFRDASFDSVVSTLVLCSVPDQVEEVREIQRVLRPDGAFYFFEHVAASEEWRRRFQDWFNGPWRFLAGGCNINRDIGTAIQSAGFSRVELRHFDMPVSSPLNRPSIVGAAWA